MFGRSGAKGEIAALAGADVDRAAVAAAKRHPQRFETLYRKYLPRVYSFAYYELGDHHDAEDVTERVFLSAFEALPAFEERGEAGSSFRVWLLRIARNAISNHRRTLARRREDPIALAEGLPAGSEPAVIAIRNEEHARAWRALAGLRNDRRRVVILRVVEELSIPDIAAVMERSEGAIRVLLHRALRDMARELARGTAS